MRRHDEAFQEFYLPKEEVTRCCDQFVLRFIERLGKNDNINEWYLWNMKAQTLQFFIMLNALLYRLFDNCFDNRENEDPNAFPIEEVGNAVLWNIVLISTVWSYGAVLNGDLRKIFDENFQSFRSKFNINFNTPIKIKYTLFDLYFDIEQLQWVMIGEKLDYKIRVMFDKPIQTVLMPTPEISQACFIQDTLLYSMRKDQELNKHFRLVGPSGSQKSVILRHSVNKLKQPFTCLPVPMSAYLTLETLKAKVEEKYEPKKKNNFVLKEADKPVLISIDDVHLQQNLKVEVLEFLRSWCICKGYFDVKAQIFKRIGNFGTMMTENSEFQATSKKRERFLFYTTTLYCEEIDEDRFKPFVQYWLTSNAWETCDMVKRFYILITNALMSLVTKLRTWDVKHFAHSTLQKLHRFQFISKFTSNLVIHSVLTDSRKEVFGEGSTNRKEEEAMAEIFCYEAMRTFGDRIMRPKNRQKFLEILAEICHKEFRWDRKKYTPAFLETLIMGNYHEKTAESHVKMISITTPEQIEAAKEKIIAKVTGNSGNQLLQLLLDAPSGLHNLYRMSRIIFKEQQHLALVGQPGTSKQELMHLVGLVNETIVLELNAPCYGAPLQFAEAFRNALLTAVKLETTPVFVLISDQQLRDPVYFDFVFNYVSQAKRAETCILFTTEFQKQLADLEAECVRKQGITQMPSDQVLFLQAVGRLMKSIHIVFQFSDITAYKECFSMYPQLEYCCEVIFLDDLNIKGYEIMASNYLERAKIHRELIGDNNNLPRALVAVRRLIRDQLINSFVPKITGNYGNQQIDECLNYGATEFVVNDPAKLKDCIFDGQTNGSYSVHDPNFRQILLNMPLERQTMNKHRFGMYLELFRFLYEFLAMHLTIRKTYLETFLKKCKQFVGFFKSVKDSKKRLHSDQNEHNMSLAMNRDKIRDINRIIGEKQESIKRKTADIREINEERTAVNEELDKVLTIKRDKLNQTIDSLASVNNSDFNYYVTKFGLPGFPPVEAQLIQTLGCVLKPGVNMDKDDYNMIFIQGSQQLSLLMEQAMDKEFSQDTFQQLEKFILKCSHGEFSRQLSNTLYNFLLELYRKLNIKNTMATTYQKVKELNSQIVTNEFSINYSTQSIEDKQKELKIQKERLHEQLSSGVSLSKKIEEAEISHMRTEQIFESVQKYADKIEKRLDSVTSRSQTLLGDSLLFSASVVFMGPFSPKEKESLRASIIKHLRDIHQIHTNKDWTTPTALRAGIKHKSMFTMALEDMGLKDFFNEDNLPHMMTKSDLTEALFALLFAPSCPVICDPTGQMQDFIHQRLLVNADLKNISGADLLANEKVTSTLWNQRFALLTDVNSLAKTSSGLSQDQSMLRRLCQFVHNGYDFYQERSKQIRELKVGNSFFSHFNQNRRMPIIDAGFEHLSLYQVMVFQSKFDYQLNDDYLQNATFICASPSFQPLKAERNDPNLFVESKCKAVTSIKKAIIQAILPSSAGYEELQENLKFVRSRISTLEKNFENSFLVASEHTLKNMEDYSELKQAVEDLIQGQEASRDYNKKLKDLLTETHVISDAARVIYLMYISLKIVSKVMNEVTYSWNQFVVVLHKVIGQLIKEKKQEKIDEEDEKPKRSSRLELDEIKIEVDVHYFRETVLPQIHKIVSCNVKTESTSFFNLIFALQLAHSQNEITESEMQFVMNQFVSLKEFWKWRQPNHEFVNMQDTCDMVALIPLQSEMRKPYPDVSRKVFDFVETKLGKKFRYNDASMFFQQELRHKYKLTDFQQITFGFMCPDSEFKGRMVQFMYKTLQETFEFTEDLPSLHEFLKAADWKEQPISVISSSALNPVNLVTSIANFYKRRLLVMRADPVTEVARSKVQSYNQALSDKINSQLIDYASVRQDHLGIHQDRLRGLSVGVIAEPQPTDVPVAKQNWNILKQRQANLDEGSLIATMSAGVNSATEAEQIEQILECARDGSWVLICPVQFPQYVIKLKEKLREMSAADEISNEFRLIFDLQGTTQNEIPDSFLFDYSATFQLGDANVDQLSSFNDIWSRVLDEACLEFLQEVPTTQTHVEVRQKLRELQNNSEEWGAAETAALKAFEAQTSSDPEQIALFKKYVQENADQFLKQYQAQKEVTHERIKAEIQKENERKAAIVAAEVQAVKDARFRNRNSDNDGSSSQLVGQSQSQSQSQSGATLAISKAHHGSALFLSTVEADNGLIHEVNTETTQSVRASRDSLKANSYQAIPVTEEDLKEESKDQTLMPPITGLVDMHESRNQTPINALNQTGSLDQDFTVKMNESKSMVEMQPSGVEEAEHPASDDEE